VRATDRADHRFPKSRRVRRREDYVATQRSSARVVTPHFVLLFRAVAGEGTRLGVTASAKQVGNAVARNRAKRLVREAFRLSPELFPALPGLRVDVVVIVRSHPGELVLPQVLAEWTKAAPAIARLAPRLRPALRPAVDALLLRGYHLSPMAPRAPARRAAPRRSRSAVCPVASVLLLLIRGYQRFLSPFLGGQCRFYPSCSRYAYACIEDHGAARGSLLSFIRLCKCHPLHPGGHDPPPPRRALPQTTA